MSSRRKKLSTQKSKHQVNRPTCKWRLSVNKQWQRAFDRKVAIVGFSFGKGHGSSPGNTNRALAWTVNELYKQIPADVKIPLCIQHEIAQVVDTKYSLPVCAIQQKHTYMSTLDIAKECSRILRQYQIHEAILVAHPDHAIRCAHALKQMGIIRVHSTPFLQSGSVPWKRFNCDKYGYSHTSTQPWTRNRKDYRVHDKHMFITKRIQLIRNHQVVGRCKLEIYQDTDEAWLESVLIYKNFRGKRYSIFLVRKAINQARRMGIKKIILHVKHDNVAAIKCYTQNGFRITRKNYDDMHVLLGYTMEYKLQLS